MHDFDSRIHIIPIASITVLNPRTRGKKTFNELVESIGALGLKKPITVARRADGPTFDLVCGQGRLEACAQLGQTEIPAFIVQASEEDCFVMSLVENVARRHPNAIELLRDIGTLRDRGYTHKEIAAKTALSEEYVYAICYFLDHGEGRLIAAVDRGVVPTNIALEIARAKEDDVQRALTEAYENKTLPGNQILAIRRIIQARNVKKSTETGSAGRTRKRVTADSLIRTYKKEMQRRKMLIRNADRAQSLLLTVLNALERLLADEHLVGLMRQEAIPPPPKSIAERQATKGV